MSDFDLGFEAIVESSLDVIADEILDEIAAARRAWGDVTPAAPQRAGLSMDAWAPSGAPMQQSSYNAGAAIAALPARGDEP